MNILIRLFDKISSVLMSRLPVFVIGSLLIALIGVYVGVPGTCASQVQPDTLCERLAADAATLNVAVDEDDWASADAVTQSCRIAALV